MTTIQISKKLQSNLKDMKLHEKESYEDIIWNLVEDSMELSEETKKEIEISRKQIKDGKVYSLEEVEKEAGL
ncbi:hypothetical protein HYZ41_02475 [archaeon]|nr:hypothetical protein [archaeon]